MADDKTNDPLAGMDAVFAERDAAKAKERQVADARHAKEQEGYQGFAKVLKEVIEPTLVSAKAKLAEQHYQLLVQRESSTPPRSLDIRILPNGQALNAANEGKLNVLHLEVHAFPTTTVHVALGVPRGNGGTPANGEGKGLAEITVEYFAGLLVKLTKLSVSR